MPQPKRSSWRGAVLAFALLAAARPTFGYNHDQHLGVVALGYKAMVAASFELVRSGAYDNGTINTSRIRATSFAGTRSGWTLFGPLRIPD